MKAEYDLNNSLKWDTYEMNTQEGWLRYVGKKMNKSNK